MKSFLSFLKIKDQLKTIVSLRLVTEIGSPSPMMVFLKLRKYVNQGKIFVRVKTLQNLIIIAVNLLQTDQKNFNQRYTQATLGGSKVLTD